MQQVSTWYLNCGRKQWRKPAMTFGKTWKKPTCHVQIRICRWILGGDSKSNFPHVIGEHIVIQAPPNSGSQYHNYKDSFSLYIGDFGSPPENLYVPPPFLLPHFLHQSWDVPYVVVADEASPIKPYFSRGHKFSITTSPDGEELHWFYCQRLQVCPDSADSIIKATCILWSESRRWGASWRRWWRE